MKNKALLEVEMADTIADGMYQDLLALERWWPKSKRGSNAQSALDSIYNRHSAVRDCLKDAARLINDADKS